MKVARSAAAVLSQRTTLPLECVDRMYLNVYVPLLRTAGASPSSVLMAPITERFVNATESYAERDGIDLVTFRRGKPKHERTREYLRKWPGGEGVLYIGRAQEKAPVPRTDRRHDPRTGHDVSVAGGLDGDGQPQRPGPYRRQRREANPRLDGRTNPDRLDRRPCRRNLRVRQRPPKRLGLRDLRQCSRRSLRPPRSRRHVRELAPRRPPRAPNRATASQSRACRGRPGPTTEGTAAQSWSTSRPIIAMPNPGAILH